VRPTVHSVALLPFCLVLALAGCRPPPEAKPEPQAPMAQAAAPVAAPPTAEEVEAARSLVARYFDLIDKGEYGAALALWSPAGRASFRNDAAYLAQQYERYSRFRGAPGPVSAIYGGSDKDNLVVPSTAQATRRSDGKSAQLQGLVYLRREQGEWAIEGVDVRKTKR